MNKEKEVSALTAEEALEVTEQAIKANQEDIKKQRQVPTVDWDKEKSKYYAIMQIINTSAKRGDASCIYSESETENTNITGTILGLALTQAGYRVTAINQPSSGISYGINNEGLYWDKNNYPDRVVTEISWDKNQTTTTVQRPFIPPEVGEQEVEGQEADGRIYPETACVEPQPSDDIFSPSNSFWSKLSPSDTTLPLFQFYLIIYVALFAIVALLGPVSNLIPLGILGAYSIATEWYMYHEYNKLKEKHK